MSSHQRPNWSNRRVMTGLSDLVRGFSDPLRPAGPPRTLGGEGSAPLRHVRVAPGEGVRNVPTPGAGVGTPVLVPFGER